MLKGNGGRRHHDDSGPVITPRGCSATAERPKVTEVQVSGQGRAIARRTSLETELADRSKALAKASDEVRRRPKAAGGKPDFEGLADYIERARPKDARAPASEVKARRRRTEAGERRAERKTLRSKASAAERPQSAEQRRELPTKATAGPSNTQNPHTLVTLLRDLEIRVARLEATRVDDAAMARAHADAVSAALDACDGEAGSAGGIARHFGAGTTTTPGSEPFGRREQASPRRLWP
ncbi:MAG: hypothetical protein AAGB11_15120 [Pseudomonadota bacterium]